MSWDRTGYELGRLSGERETDEVKEQAGSVAVAAKALIAAGNKLASQLTTVEQCGEVLDPHGVAQNEWRQALEQFQEELGAMPASGTGELSLGLTLALSSLLSLEGVDAVYRSGDTIFLVGREHGDVDTGAWLEIERKVMPLQITFRAHQGRDPDSMFPGLPRLYSDGVLSSIWREPGASEAPASKPVAPESADPTAEYFDGMFQYFFGDPKRFK